MAMNGEQVIKIPVQAEIENAQNIVKELQNIASKMKPETRGFREINTLLNQAETRLERIYAQSSRGIIDKRGLNQIERGFQQTLDIIDQAARKVSSINFNSLGLSPDQIKGFNDIAAKINEAEQAYEKLSRIKLDELAKSSEQFSTALAKVGVDLKTDTVESSLNKVESAVKKVSNELETLEAKKRKAETTALVKEEEVQKLERIKDIFSQTANRAEFKEFFASNGNFKAGGKDKLVDLMRMLGFDQATLDKVKQMTASQLKDLWESVYKQAEKLQQRRRNQAANATSNANALGAQISIDKDQIQNLSALQQGLQDLKVSPELQNALTQLNTRLTQLEQENEALKASILNSSGAVEGAKRAFGETSSAAENFRAKIRGIAEELDRTAIATRNMQSIKNLVVNFLGFNQILNTIRNGIRNAINHIKELDATMNGIAIVTDMTTADLWKQVDAYSSMAQKFGVTIQGAYEVSKIYYQAGYETNEVLTLTNETLKLSKISGLDYATTTDYMMTAMRGFKLEMEDACRVVDVYSNLAANTAVSQQELAEAMTRTASSMESVGATFEETSAMIATMVAVTRESANNIGSAMKSIASRYGELTKDPQKLFDAEGEAMSFNKVDAALKSVGISIQTTEHQFRDFTDVIMELAEVWDTLDSAQQRYIATQFAGNRQQSRFLALISNVDLLKENIKNAEDSEDIGTLQYLKALDSLDSKIKQVEVSYQQFYTTIGIENVWKTFLDGTRNAIDTLNRLPKLFGKIPVLAIAMIGNIINVIRSALRIGFKMIITDWQTVQEQLANKSRNTGTEISEGLISMIIRKLRESRNQVVQEVGQTMEQARNEADNKLNNNQQNQSNGGIQQTEKAVSGLAKLGQNNGLTKTFTTLSGIASVVSLLIPTASQAGKVASGAIMGVAGALKVFGAASAANPVLAVISGIAMIASGIATAIESSEERLERLNAEAEELNNKAKEAKANYNTLQRSIDKVEELKEKRYESKEAAEEYQEAVDELADTFPEMISGFDEAGNIIIDITNKENILAEAREKTAKATYDAAQAELKSIEEQRKQAKEKANEAVGNNKAQVSFSENNFPDFLWSFLGKDSESQLKFLAKHINWDQYGEGYSENAHEYHNRDEMMGIYYRQGGTISNLLQEKDITFDGLAGTIDDFRNIFQILDLIDVTSDVGQNLYTQAKILYDKAKKTYPNIEKEFKEVFESTGAAIDEYNNLAKLSASEIKTIISAWQNLNKEFSYITDGSGLAQILTDYIAQRVGNDVTSDKLKELLESDEYKGIQNEFEAYWERLAQTNKTRADRLKEMLSNPERYTKEDISREFKDLEGFDKYLVASYDQRAKNVKNNLINSIKGNKEQKVPGLVSKLQEDLQDPLINLADSLEVVAGELSYEESQILGNAARKYVDMAKSGFAEQGKQMLLGTEYLINAVKDNPIEEAYLASLLSKNSLFTKEGVQAIIDGINENSDIAEGKKEELIQYLSVIKNNIINNYSLAIQTAISELEEGWENAGKEMAKLRSGASLKEANAAIEAAKALGIEISRSDFSGPANKLVLSEGKFYEYFYATQEQVRAQANEMESYAQQAKNITDGWSSGTLVEAKAWKEFTDNQKLFSDILGEQLYTKVIDEGPVNFIAKNKAVIEEKIKEYGEDVSEFQLMLEQTQEQMLREINWAIGNYADLFKNGFDESQLRSAAAQAGRNLSKTQISERDAVKKINEVYSKLISDVLSKGFANIDLTQYSGLLNAGSGIAENLSGSYEEFVRKYVDLTGKTVEEINSLMVQAIEKDNKKTTVMTSAIKDMASLSVSQIGELANLLSEQLGQVVDPRAIIASIKQNADGTYNGSEYIVNYLIPKLFGEDVPEAVQNALDTTLNSAVENAIKGLNDISSNLSKGFSSIADVEKFGSQLKNVEFSKDFYRYEEVLNQYVFTEKGITESIKNYAIELAGVLSRQGKTSWEVIFTLRNELEGLRIASAQQVDIQKYISSNKTEEDKKSLEVAYQNWKYTNEALGRTISLTYDQLSKSLEAGGEAAVRIANFFAEDAGKSLTAKEVEAAYRSQANKLEDAAQMISYGIGGIIDQTTSEILKIAGYKFDKIDQTSQYVITSTGNLADAYLNLYYKMDKDNATTLARLNEIMALYFEAGSEKQAIDFVGDAAKMSWTRLAEAFSKAGYKMTTELIAELTGQGIIEDLKNGNVRVLKPEQLLNILGMNPNSEEYISALKTLNDSLIEANNKISNNIVEEVKNIAAAKPGEQINITQLYKKLNVTSQEILARIANALGAELDDGILTLTENANILGLVKNISAYANEKGILLKNQIIELADTLNDTLESYIDLFSKGIQGKLSNTDARSLQNYAATLGINKLDFTETANGLKISANSAGELYFKLKQVDSIKASLVFDELSESIQKSDENASNLSVTLKTISSLEKELAKTPNNTAVKQRLELYKEIAAQQAADPEQYNFMNRSLPSGMQGVENYWNSVGSAFKAMNEAGKSGYMEVQDFYNIVNEMSNLAALSGNSIEFMGQTIDGKATTAASLIQNAMSALTNVDGEGVKLSLDKLGANLLAGAEGMESGFDDGIKAMAKAQIKMLDAAIQMLEGIVALQELGDIDDDKNGVIDFKELFFGDEATQDVTGFQTNAQKAAKDVLNAAKSNDDLMAALDTFKIGELKLRDILNAIANNKWSDIKDKITPQQLLDLFNVFKDIDFENADLVSIQQVINEAWNKIFPQYDISFDQEVLDRVNSYFENIGQHDKNVISILQGALVKARKTRSVQEEIVYEIAQNEMGYNELLKFYTGAHGENLGEDPDEALIQNMLLNAGYSNEGIEYTYSENKKASSGKIKVNYEGLEIEVEAGIDGEIKYSNGKDQYNTLDEAIKNSDAFKEFKNENKNVNLSEEELLTQFKYDVGIEINPRIKIDTEKFQNAEKTKIAQVKELMKQALSGELEIGADELVQDAKEIGIELTLDKSGNLVMPQLESALVTMTESIQAINTTEELGYLQQTALAAASIDSKFKPEDSKDTSGQDETGGKEVTPEEDVSGQDKKATTEKNTNNESINSNWLVGIIDQFKAAPSDSKAILDAAGITAEDLEILNKSLEANTEKISEGIEKNAKNADYEASTNWKTVAASLLAEAVAATPQGQAAQQNLGSVAPVTSLSSGMQQRANIEAAQRFRAENGIDVNANANINAKETVEEVQEEVNSYGPVTAEVELQVQEEKLEELKHQLNNWLEQTGYSFKELNEKIQDGSIDDQILDEYLKLKEQIDQCTKKIEELRNEAEKKSSINIDGTQAQSTVDKVKLAVDKLRNVASATTKINIDASSAHGAINNLLTKAQEAALKLKSFFSNSPKTSSATAATGNVALAAGRTLMGELGPELYVTRGRYYVAGQNGAEFVNLPEDAIVFNHIQTKRLLTNGNSGRGVPVTNERKATSLATGNMTGPAMASAAAVLAQLKQIRAMWDALLNASISDLGSKAGLGKSGGGGGKDKDDNKTIKLDAGYIRDLEKWYNLLRKIERLEIDINYEEKLRAKLNADSIAHGEKLYESYKRSFDLLQQEVDNRVKLAELKKGYWEQQMKEAQESEWGRLFTFDENGTVQMKEGTMQLLANIYGSSATGGALHSAREQYAMLQQAGFGALMEYKDDGSRIEWTNDDGTAREEAYKEAVEAFSSRIDSTSDELKSLYEEYMEEMESILDLQTKQNEILNQIKENTVSVEQEVISALEESREREINELQKSRDALNESTDKFINGLTDQLNKEREMYQTQQTNQETMKLQRQLAILQRSGGSASQIANLQEQISQRQQDAYFEAQEKQIDAIKEASNLQLERLDAQISIMNETLEYQKEHGLLWEQVQQIMSGSAEEIYDFITANKAEWWNKSQTERELADKELNNSLQLWVANREDLSNLGTTIKTAMTNGITAITSVVSNISTSSPYTVTGDGNPTITTPSGGGAVDGGAGGGSSGGSSTAGQASRNNNISHYKFTYNGVQKKGYTSENDAIAAINALATEDRRKKITNNMGRTEQDYWYTTIAGWVRDAKKTIARYSKGGIIDFTGPAWVDGTKERPEGILNAEQLDMLRNMVLTKKNPLMNILADYNNTLNNTANNPYGSINHNSNESIVIENATVNMNVQKIANDYDARRAGELALDEMVKIAQKNGFSNIRR